MNPSPSFCPVPDDSLAISQDTVCARASAFRDADEDRLPCNDADRLVLLRGFKDTVITFLQNILRFFENCMIQEDMCVFVSSNRGPIHSIVCTVPLESPSYPAQVQALVPGTPMGQGGGL